MAYLPYHLRRAIERRLVTSLVRSPAFNRGVERVNQKIYEFRHGKLPEDMGGTKLDEPDRKGVKYFFKLFVEEVRTGHRSIRKNQKG